MNTLTIAYLIGSVTMFVAVMKVWKDESEDKIWLGLVVAFSFALIWPLVLIAALTGKLLK